MARVRRWKRALRSFAQSWVDSLPTDTEVATLDVDSPRPPPEPRHGHQQLAMSHGFCDERTYHPLLVSNGLTGQFIAARPRELSLRDVHEQALR